MNLTYQVVPTKDPIDGVLVTKHEMSSIYPQHRKNQGDANRGQKPLEIQRHGQLFVTPNQASQLMTLKKPFTRARICLAESLYELEALLGHIKASTVFSELQEFYSFIFSNNRKRKTFNASSPTRCICRRESRDWGYRSRRRGKRRSFNDLCLCSSLPQNNAFRHAIKYKGANTTWSSNYNNKSQEITLRRETLGPSTKSTGEGFHSRVVQIRQDSALPQRRRSFKALNNDTLRSESSFLCMQDPYKHASISEPESIKQAYPSNEADRSKSRIGSRGDPALVPFSGTQTNDDFNNTLLNHGGILKLEINQVGQPGNRDLSDNDFVEISKEVEGNNKHNASEFVETVDGGNQLMENSVTKQYDTHQTSQQLSFYTGYPSLVKSSMEQLEEMPQSGRENRSLIRNSIKQVQQVQSVDPTQLADDPTESSVPVYGEERKLKSDMRNKEPQDPSDPRFAVKGRKSSLISQDVEPCAPIFGEESQITPRSMMAEKKKKNSMFMDRDEELSTSNILEEGKESRFFTVTTKPTRLNSSMRSFDGVQPEQLQTPRLSESSKSRMTTEMEEGADVVPSDYERSLPSQKMHSLNQTSVYDFNVNKRNMCEAILRVAELEERKSRLVLGDEVESPSGTYILAEGRNLNVMVSDEKPFSLAEGRKSKSIMERHDEDSGAYCNYRRSFSVSHPVESSSSLQSFDNVQQVHTQDPRLADSRNSRISINMEDDTLQSLNCQRNSLSHCPRTTRASMNKFNMIEPEMEDTSMAASCLFDVQVPYENTSMSECQTYPNVVQHTENQKYYPLKDADSRQSRKGSRDYPDVVLFYGTQDEDDSNNVLQNHKSLAKLGSSCQPNEIARTFQPENRDLPRDDSAKMSKEKDNTHQHFIASLVDISGAKREPGQSGTSDTSQQVSSEVGYPCEIKHSQQQIQDMMQYENKNRSSVRKSRQQGQPFSSYMQSQRQPIYQHQVAADGMMNVAPRESIPADLSPHLQSSDLVENEMDCNPETGVAIKSMCMQSVKSKHPASRISIQAHKNTANYSVPDTINDIIQPKNELVTTITQPVESSMQDKSNPFDTRSESYGPNQTRAYSEESDVQGLSNRLSDEVISRRNQFGQMHKSTEAHISQSSLHLEQRKSTLSVNKEFWQSLLGSEYIEGKLSRLGVSDTSQKRKSALQDGVSSATIFAADGRKPTDILPEKHISAPTFMEGRKSKAIVQNKECYCTAAKSKSSFMLQDKELQRPTATSFLSERRESSFISHHDELSGPSCEGERRKSELIVQDDQTSAHSFAGEGRKSECILNVELADAQIVDFSLKATLGRKSKVIDRDEEPSGLKAAAERKPKFLIERDNDEAASLDCRRSLVDTDSMRLSSSMASFDCASFKAPRFSENRMSMITPVSSVFQKGLSIAFLPSANRSMESFDDGQQEYSQAPSTSESSKSRISMEREEGASHDQKNSTHIHPSSITKVLVRDFDEMKFNETKALAVVTQLEGTKSRSVSGDEEAESSALTSLLAKGSKLKLFFGNEEPLPVLASERKSRVEENLRPSLDHQRGLSVSCPGNPSRCVEVEHLQDPKLLERRRASIGVGNKEDDTALLDHQRNPTSRMSSRLSTTLASMRDFNMVKPLMKGTSLPESSVLCVQDSIENGSIPESERNLYVVQHITSPQPYPLIDADRRQSRKASKHYPEIAPVTGIQSKTDEVGEFPNNDLVKMLKGEDDRQEDSGASIAHGGDEQRTDIPRKKCDMSQELLSEARYSFLRKNLQERQSSVQKLIKQVQPCTSYRQSQIQSKDPNQFTADVMGNVKPRARKPMNHSVDFNIALYGHPSSDLQSSKLVEYGTNSDAAKGIARKSIYMELGQNEEPASRINIQATAANKQPKIYAEGKSVYQGRSSTSSTQEFCVMDSEGESSFQDEFYPMGIFPMFSNQLQIPSNSEEGVAQGLDNRFSDIDISMRNQILQMRKSEEGNTPHTSSPEEGVKSKLPGQPSTNQILMRGFDMNKLIESESLAVGADLKATKSTFVSVDKEAEGPPSDPILAKGRKSKIIIDKDDENATMSSDYQKSLPVSCTVRSSNPMLRFSAVKLEHPHTTELSDSRPLEREQDSTPSSYQKNPTSGQPSMTQAWMQDFQMMIKPSMKATSMSESPSFSVEYTCENGSTWKHETFPYDVKYRASSQPSTSNGTDIRHIRKGSRDYQDVAPFSGTQSKNENNNHQPNPIVFSHQQEISGLPEDDSVQMLEEVQGNARQTSNHVCMDLRDAQRTDQRKSQTGTPNTPRQLHSEARHSSLKRNSRDQFQETSHFEMNSRSSVRKSSEIQHFSSGRKSQMRSMDRNQVATDALWSVEPRENMPRNPSEGLNICAYSHPNPDSQSIDLVEYEVNVNQETGTARMSMYVGPVLTEEPMFRNSIQELKNTANYVGPDTRNVKKWSTNELMTAKDQSNPYLRESSSMYQGRSSVESMRKLNPGNSQGEQSSQHELSPRSGSSTSHHSASYSKENDVQGLGNRLSESLSHAEGRKSSHNVHNKDLQCSSVSFFGDEKKSSYNVMGEELQKRKTSFMEQSLPTFAGERITPGSTSVNVEPSGPTFAGEGRDPRSIFQNEEPFGPKIAGETDKARLIVQEKEPQVASSSIMAVHGKNSMFIDVDKKPSASFSSGDGRKSSYLMKRDENPVAYVDYKGAEPTRSRHSLPSFDSASQESPRLSESKKFKISFESEEEASSPYKSTTSVSSTLMTVPQSTGSFNEESEDPMSSHCQTSFSITHSAIPISSMQRLDGARIEHLQPPKLIKSWLSLEREQDATPSDYRRKLTSSQLSSTTGRSMCRLSMIEPNQTLAVAGSDEVRSKIVLGDEEGNSQSTVSIFAEERKLGFMATNEKPHILANRRKSRIIVESNDEDLDASLDYERAASGSHSGKPSNLVQIFDGVQLEQPQAPNFSGSRKSKMSMEKEDDAILSDDQRNSTFNLPCRSTQSEGMETKLALGNDGDSRHPTPTFSKIRESSIIMSDEELSISPKGRKSRIIMERDDEDPAAFSGFERDMSVSHSSKSSCLRNTTSSHSFATRTSVRAFDLMEPNKSTSAMMSKVIGRSECNLSNEIGTPTHNRRNSTISWPSATQVPIGDFTMEPNEREVIGRSEWNITSELNASNDNWKKCTSSRQDVAMIEPNESEVIFSNDVSTCIDDWSNSTLNRPSTIRVSIRSFDVTEPIENEIIFTNEVDTSRYNWRTSTSSQPSTIRASMRDFDVMELNESEFIFTDEVGTFTDDWESWQSTTQHSMQEVDSIKQNEYKVVSRNEVGTSTDSCVTATQESMRDFDSIEPNESEIRMYEWNASNEADLLSDYQINSTSNVPSKLQQFYTSRIVNKKQDKKFNRSFQISGREKRNMGYNNLGRSLNILSLQSLLLRKNAFRYWGHNNPTSSSNIASVQPPLSRKNAFRPGSFQTGSIRSDMRQTIADHNLFLKWQSNILTTLLACHGCPKH